MVLNYLFMTCAMYISEHVIYYNTKRMDMLQRDTHLENTVVVITGTTLI